MKKKKLFVGILMASAVFGLAACGGNTGTTTTSGTDTGTTTTQVATKYSVKFMDGTTEISTTEVEEGKKVAKPTTNPTKAEDANNTYEFVGWCKDASLTTEFNFETDTISAATTIYAKYAAVSKDTAIKMNGTEYATIQEAFAAVPAASTDTFVITLPKGTYTVDDGLAYNGSATIKIKGNTATKYGADVIIKGHGSDMGQEKTRSMIAIQGTGNIILENVTLESDWTRALAGGNNAQAEVLGTDTKGNTIAYNCGFKSHQDTLRTAGKAWFYGCYIEGDTDFIWMEQAGSVALYEQCEIVSIYDESASTHASYVTAPRMAKTMKVGKGLVIFNSTVKENAEANEKTQLTYLARNPWSNVTDYFNQVAYINTDCSDIEEKIWYNSGTVTEFDKTAIGYKMDKATADSIGYAGDGDIVDEDTVSKEFSGRETILNRIYDTGKLKYTKDEVNYWDIATVISENGFFVAADSSKSTLDGEVAGQTTTYKFDGSEDVASMVSGFAKDGTKTHFVGQAGATITVPVSGKCYVEVYGYYAGTVETQADTQGKAVMFFNNGTTNAEVEQDYIVYDTSAKEVVITAKATTYITKIVVTSDNTIEKTDVSSIEVTGNTENYQVGVALKLAAKVGPGTATNKSVVWSSSDETIGTVDQYTGKVTFLQAGTVTFTATACDGSGKTGTITCTPKEAKWTVAEWYTTDGTLATEDGAKNISVFDPTGSSSKDFKINNVTTNYSLVNIDGKTISTAKGLKLNSTGKLVIATTKGDAKLTLITIDAINNHSTPVVKDGDTKLTCESETSNGDGTTTYVYTIPSAGSWTIMRGNDNAECNPLLYAKCEYENVISTAKDLTFGTDGNYESEVTEFFKISAQIVNNGGNNAQVKGGNIEFTVAAGAQVEVYANWGEAYIINDEDGNPISHDGTGVGNDGQRYYTYSKKTKVVIQCDPEGTGHNYFYWIKVTFPTA
ncbi:MAG: Ig-like domain-containing protein [Acholeplasmatales bacterium]|nr:Ig-like domain-containing protein [Acholeplasmatales bacterium]